jgi:hypothetical protein
LSAPYRSVETFSKNSCTPEDAPVDANASVSVGLIITELFRKNCVIWWLKIFPLFGWEPSTSESSTLTLDDIQDVSRDMREKIVDERNPSYNGTIKDATDRMNDDKKLPADSEMQEAVERVRDADNEEKSRQAEEQSDWRSAVQ